MFELRMMGDAIMSMPFVRAAKEKYDVFVCCQPSVQDVFRTWLPEDRIIIWRPPWLDERRKYSLSKWQSAGAKAIVQRLRNVRPRVAVSGWADARVHVLMAVSRAKERVGFPMNRRNLYASSLPWRRRQILIGNTLNWGASALLGRRLLTRKLNRNDYLQHHVDDWRQLSEALGLDWNPGLPWFAVPSQRLPEAVCGWLQRARAAGHKIWLVHPGARMPHRRWPLEKWSMLIKQMLKRGQTSVMVIDPVESRLPPGWMPEVFTYRPNSLAAFFRILSAADYIICNDTGVSHAAAALGKRVVSIFSSNLPQWFAPYQNLDLVAHNNVCPHRPCLDRCVMSSFVCLEAVTVKIVEQQVEKLLSIHAGTDTPCSEQQL